MRRTHRKKKKLYQISQTDAKALFAAVLYMGSNDKTNYKDYWSKDDDKKDAFIAKLLLYAKLSARKFHRITNAIRLYSKADATEKHWNDKKHSDYDEHYKVCCKKIWNSMVFLEVYNYCEVFKMLPNDKV